MSAAAYPTKQDLEAATARNADWMATPNPMIAAAIERDEDTTGLCTVREVAEMILADDKRSPVEMYFDLAGTRVNVLVMVLTPGEGAGIV
jgi:hypothetical protein